MSVLHLIWVKPPWKEITNKAQYNFRGDTYHPNVSHISLGEVRGWGCPVAARARRPITIIPLHTGLTSIVFPIATKHVSECCQILTDSEAQKHPV